MPATEKIRAQCIKCGATGRLPQTKIGTKIRCPKCDLPTTFKAIDEPAPTPELETVGPPPATQSAVDLENIQNTLVKHWKLIGLAMLFLTCLIKPETGMTIGLLLLLGVLFFVGHFVVLGVLGRSKEDRKWPYHRLIWCFFLMVGCMLTSALATDRPATPEQTPRAATPTKASRPQKTARCQERKAKPTAKKKAKVQTSEFYNAMVGELWRIDQDHVALMHEAKVPASEAEFKENAFVTLFPGSLVEVEQAPFSVGFFKRVLVLRDNKALFRGWIMGSVVKKAYRVSKAGQWTSGGTLHQATIEQWSKARHANKLATAGDWLAATKWKGHLKKPEDFLRLKRKARILVEGVDAMISSSKGAYSGEPANKLATLLLVMPQSAELAP